MSIINWDGVGERVYETGVDRGVLYLPNGSVVPWNGLTSMVETMDKDTAEVYYDGMKINDLVTLGNFSATAKAFTYPEELSSLETYGESRPGLYLGDRPPQLFGLCYRTKTGDDVSGINGYKLHIVYNVTAIPKNKAYNTMDDDVDIVEFEWDIRAVSEEVPGFRPTAHIIIDSRHFDPWLLEEVEAQLYGSSTSVAVLLPMAEMLAFITEWFRFQVTDNGDGTFTVVSARDSSIQFDNIDPSIVYIFGIDVVYLDDNGLIQLSDTYDISEVAYLKIVDNGDGTWVASTSHSGLIYVEPDGSFEIRNANAVYTDPNTYRISTSVSES